VANAEVDEGGITPVTAGDRGADRCAALDALAQFVKLLGNIDCRRARCDTALCDDGAGGTPPKVSGNAMSEGAGDRVRYVATAGIETMESKGECALEALGKSDTADVLAIGVTGKGSSAPDTIMEGSANIRDDAVASRDGFVVETVVENDAVCIAVMPGRGNSVSEEGGRDSVWVVACSMFVGSR
jgi:hypothetical protein